MDSFSVIRACFKNVAQSVLHKANSAAYSGACVHQDYMDSLPSSDKYFSSAHCLATELSERGENVT
jgi:hypothetical protein